MQISPLLKIEPGVTALIGGGGKTTLLYTLAGELSQKGRVIVCTTTHIRRPDHLPVMTGTEEGVVLDALDRHRIVCLGSPAEEDKLTMPSLPFDRLTGLAEYVLVEADGARGLPCKAHAGHEPVIPDSAGRTVLVIGADAFGRPIAEVCHRPGLCAERIRVTPDTVLTPKLAARLIETEGYGDCVYVNKVESAGDLDAAGQLAGVLSCPVIAGSLQQGVYTICRDWY